MDITDNFYSQMLYDQTKTRRKYLIFFQSPINAKGALAADRGRENVSIACS